ncbi:MGMT family protein [Candidatus Woesearchaeota archaeon]|nr:MAG: methylated-DNA-[protein]-cysteine S-methyltransferase [archaeon GW2011_AR18]MBS3161508.1 MGMT family protein [Candidatus Woesearchaeota archaeon]HIH25291.1 MGMT family protein [Nanoarchaeota archaeon]
MNFNDKVYRLCKLIPKGKVSTYKEIAKALDSRGYRAVGNALNKNPYAPVVPCHRVVSYSSHLHGFLHGLAAKRKLLESEGIKIKNNKVIDFEKVLFRF